MAESTRSRTERDSMGAIEVPDERYWGAQTQRSLENFRIGGERMPLALIRALALQKKAAALANMELGALDKRLGDAIVKAADEVIAGQAIGTTDLVYHIKIAETEAGEMALRLSEGKLRKISITFKLGGEVLITKKEFTLTQDSYVVIEAPQFSDAALVGTHHALSINWQTKGSVQVKSGTKIESKQPTAVTLFLVFRLPSPPGSWRLPVAVGVTFWLWANLDAWFVLGPIALGLLLLGELIQQRFLAPSEETAAPADEPIVTRTLAGARPNARTPAATYVAAYPIPGRYR